MNTLKNALKKGQMIAMNVPEIKQKVYEATSNEKWGPTGPQMRFLSDRTSSYEDFPLIMEAIWERLGDDGKNWRHVYKSLLLLDYLLRNGSQQVVREARAHVIEIKTLSHFQHIDEKDKDVGLSVRERAKQVVELIHDDRRLKEERQKAKSNRDKYSVSISSDSARRGYGGSRSPGYGGNRSPGYGGSRSPGYEDDYSSQRRGGGNRTHHRPPAGRRRRSPPPPSDSDDSYGSDSYESPPPPSSRSRPRRPSFDGTPEPEQTQQTVTQGISLLDLSEPTNNNNNNFFGAPVSQPAPTQNTFNFAQPQPTTNNTGFQPTTNNTSFQPTTNNTSFQQQPNTSFQPTTTNTNTGVQPTTTTSHPAFYQPANTAQSNNDDWGDFQSGSQQNTAQQNNTQQKQGPKLSASDPWARQDLFNLDLTSNSKKNNDNNKNSSTTPMGALTGTRATGAALKPTAGSTIPMGSGRPMGNNTTTTSQFGGFNNTGGMQQQQQFQPGQMVMAPNGQVFMVQANGQMIPVQQQPQTSFQNTGMIRR